VNLLHGNNLLEMWICSSCTYINDDDPACECCGATNASQQPAGSQQAAPAAAVAATAVAEAPAGHDVVCIDSDGEDSQLQPAETFTGRPAARQQPVQAGAQQQRGQQQQEGLYVLDCGCHGDSAELFHRLQVQAQVLQQLPDCSLQEAVQALACPRCSKLISNADAFKVTAQRSMTWEHTCVGMLPHLLHCASVFVVVQFSVLPRPASCDVLRSLSHCPHVKSSTQHDFAAQVQGSLKSFDCCQQF
jgi:hypothetical protein